MQKTITEKLKANSIMKKIFHSSIDLTDFNLIKTTINENRLQIIEDTFKNGKKLYAKFNNPNKILTKTNDCCRITGFDFDTGRKSKSMAYKWDKETLNISDDIIFDFIPFAFSKSDESFFINNNYSIEQLVKTNNLFETEENFRKKLIENLKKSSDYLNYDVEVILKNIDAEYYETLFLRKNNIELLNKIENFEILERKIKINDNYYIDLQKDVFNRIINNIYLDDIILLCLKKGISIVNKLIEINMYLYGVNMNDEMKRAFATAKEIARNIEENKISSYKQKLISCITFKDYEKFCNILLQLSMYSKTEISFAYSLFENFEENKNLAYTFINALGKDYYKENKTGDKNE